MNFDLNPKAVGFKDMNPLQIKALLDFVDFSIECAVENFDPKRLEKLEEYGSEMIQLFGGNGLKIDLVD